jgi:aryl carrier-like protein
MIAQDEGVRMLQEVLFANRTPQAALMPLVRSRLPANLGPFFAQLQQARPASAAPASGTAAAVDILPRLAAASAEERPALLSAFLADQVVKVLALGASHRVDLHRSLMDLGMDSLMAMELRNRIQTSVKARVAVADLLKGPSIHTLTADLLAGMGDTDAALPGAVAAPQQPATMAVPAQQWEEGSL